jgi:hypothetical protein
VNHLIVLVLFLFLHFLNNAVAASHCSLYLTNDSSDQTLTDRLADFVRAEMLTSKGAIKNKYLSQSGLISLIKANFENHNIDSVHRRILIVLSAENRKIAQQKWRAYQGTVNDYENEIERILDAQSGEVKSKYLSQDGYLLYAKQFYPNNNMSKVHSNVSAALSKDQRSLLRHHWSEYRGTPAELIKEREQISSPESSKIKEKYLSAEGYLLYAEEFYPRENMTKAYRNALAALKKMSGFFCNVIGTSTTAQLNNTERKRDESLMIQLGPSR